MIVLSSLLIIVIGISSYVCDRLKYNVNTLLSVCTHKFSTILSCVVIVHACNNMYRCKALQVIQSYRIFVKTTLM